METSDNIILFYKEHEKPYGCFSNFYKAHVTYNGIDFKTSEHAFQAYKHIHNKKVFDEITNAPTPTNAKKIGSNRKNKPREDWEAIKVKTMEEIIYCKFTQNKDCKDVLLSTGDNILIEHTYNDTYWADGGGNGRGKNMLGITLMKIREQIKNEMQLQSSSNALSGEIISEKKIGKIRVGRIIYGAGNAPIFTSKYDGFTQIFVMIKDDPNKNQYGALSPYSIRIPIDGYPFGVIHENYWQFSKVYKEVPKIQQTASTHNNKIVWIHNKETHLDDYDNPLSTWFAWNKKGFECQDYVRFPVGSNKKMRSSCKYSLKVHSNGFIDVTNKMNYIDARKKIYAASYCKNVIKHKLFDELLNRMHEGENLLLIEVDGPHQESLEYYQKKYNWTSDTIANNSMELSIDKLQILINDDKHAFGHGYCLGMALMDKTYGNIIKQICE